MRSVGLTIAILSLFYSRIYSQDTKRAVLGQFNLTTFASNTTEKKPTIKEDEALSILNLGDYDYVLEKEADKSYKSYQVIKLDELDDKSLIIGMITNSLARESRFIEIGAFELEAIAQGDFSDKMDYVFVHPYEKQYYITPEGQYKFIDGRELVGNKKVITYLEKGKPITIATFYFAMRKKGIIKKEMSLRTFISLSLEDKLKLMDMNLFASTKR